MGINISRLQSRAFTSLRSLQVRCSQVTCCDSNTFPSLMQKVRFKDLICSHMRKSHESFPNPHPPNSSLSLFVSLHLSLSLCPSPPPPTYCTFQVWDSGWKTMKAANPPPRTPPPHPLSFAQGNGTGNQQSSPLTEITRAFLAEHVEEECSVLLNSSSTAWPVVSAHHSHHDYVEGQHRCRRQRQPWHLSSPDPYLVPSL